MAETDRPGEFEAIARWLAPLARRSPGSLGLLDDAAVLSPASGHELVLTLDTMVSGVHFVADDPPDLVARKLLRANLSDLAAMGAEPVACLLALTLSEAEDAGWLEGFAAGLGEDLEAFGVDLLGGDTTSTAGALTLSLTALGQVPAGRAIRRSTASAGEDVWVTGTLGDAALALALMQGRSRGRGVGDFPLLHERYRLPRPRTGVGPRLHGIATAMIDISDGLCADLGHICETSGVGAAVDFVALPLSAEARRLLDADPPLAAVVAGGGDDYELLFTAKAGEAPRIAALAAETGVAITRIGVTCQGEAVEIRGADGAPMALEAAGWRHF